MYAPATPPAELIAQCVSGDDAARARFYGEYIDVVRKSAARTLHRYGTRPPAAADIDDLANEVFAKLLANDCALLDGVRNGRSLYAWLVAITRNHVIDQLRRDTARSRAAAALVREERAAYAPSSVPAAVSNEHAASVRAAVAVLPPPDRLALELYFLQGLTYAQIADILNENANTVSARVRRAKAKLRQVLEREGIREP